MAWNIWSCELSYIKKMKELTLLFKLNLSNDKCHVCVESKSAEKTCIQLQNGETELTMTRAGSKVLYYLY